MRDIRGDLQDRANRASEQISATQGQFDKVLEQLKLEHQTKLAALKSDLDAVRMVMKMEDRLGAPGKQRQSMRPQRSQQAHSQQATSDSLMLPGQGCC